PATFCDSTPERVTATAARKEAASGKRGTGLSASAASRISPMVWPLPARKRSALAGLTVRANFRPWVSWSPGSARLMAGCRRRGALPWDVHRLRVLDDRPADGAGLAERLPALRGGGVMRLHGARDRLRPAGQIDGDLPVQVDPLEIVVLRLGYRQAVPHEDGR